MNIKNFLISAVVFLCGSLTVSAQKYVGGDISAFTYNQTFSPTYLDKDGNTIADPIAFFKEQGMNAMRVRLFIDPSKYTASDKDAWACQDLDYVKALGKKIKDAGLKLMLDFHYSDTWADPAKQWTPADWASLSDNELYDKIYTYTKESLQAMKDAGAEPDFIQTGNEISYGMLWGAYGTTESSLKKCYTNSDAANWSRFTTLLKQAGKACREVCPNAKIILHTERAAQPSVLTNFYDKMKDASVDYDIIGLSYYPIWHGAVSTLETALYSLETKYTDKDIMIVETGAAYSWLPDSKDYTPSYAASEAGQLQFTQDLIAMLGNHAKVTGLFWWNMDYNAYPWATTGLSGWWYAPLFNSNTGKAMSALYELKTFLGEDTGVSLTEHTAETKDMAWYTLDGKKVGQPTKSGTYINNHKKYTIK